MVSWSNFISGLGGTMENYILQEDGEIRKEPDLLKWAKQFEKADRHVGNDTIGDIVISTVFLGIDHNHGNDGKPILFETMIFGGEHDEYQERYTDVKSAKIGHRKALELVKSSSS